MIRDPRPADRRKPRLLIPDASPLSLLGTIGEEALDWLFVPQIGVWITDMVMEEVLRDPGPEADPRLQHRAEIRHWITRNESRLHLQRTDTGLEYDKAMRAWDMAGQPAELRPSWAGRGDRSVLEAINAASRIVDAGETVVAIVDDRALRAALLAYDRVNIDLMATQSFIEWMAATFKVTGADTAWSAIEMASGGKAPRTPDEDPVYIRTSRPDPDDNPMEP